MLVQIPFCSCNNMCNTIEWCDLLLLFVSVYNVIYRDRGRVYDNQFTSENTGYEDRKACKSWYIQQEEQVSSELSELMHCCRWSKYRRIVYWSLLLKSLYAIVLLIYFHRHGEGTPPSMLLHVYEQCYKECSFVEHLSSLGNALLILNHLITVVWNMGSACQMRAASEVGNVVVGSQKTLFNCYYML